MQRMPQMAETTMTTAPADTMARGSLVGAIARQRELSLLIVMVVLGAGVTVAAPQFLTANNLSQVAILASITAIAAIGQALVVLTRNIDLSVEATMGLVAYCVAVTLEGHVLNGPGAILMGIAIGAVLGMVNGTLVTIFRVPSIVATLGTLSIFRGIDYFIAGPHQVPLSALPDGFTDPAHDSILGIPMFVVLVAVVVVIGTDVLRWTRFGRQLYAVGSNPEAAAILGIPARGVVFVAYTLCGLLAGIAAVMWVMQYGTISGTAATGYVLAVVAAVVVGGVNIFGGSGSVLGAAIGAFFLGFVANALILVGLSQFWLQAIYGAVILLAVSADLLISRRIERITAASRAR
jgi:rhamnose transport system permease protein